MAVGSIKSMFIAVDPTQDQPMALERALITAKLVSGSMSREALEQLHIHVFVAPDADNVDTSADNEKLYRGIEWFTEKLLDPLEESGFKYDVEICWSSDWYSAITRSAKRCGAERIMIPMAHKPRAHERLFGESVWHLLRTANCPVLICQPHTKAKRDKVLAAVNFQSHKPEYQRLNDELIERGRWFADNYDGELHFVNAYRDSLHYPDRSQLAQKTGVDSSRIHVQAGAPDDVIAQVAREIGADVVVLGARPRTSRWRGNTSERIISKVDCDILVVN